MLYMYTIAGANLEVQPFSAGGVVPGDEESGQATKEVNEGDGCNDNNDQNGDQGTVWGQETIYYKFLDTNHGTQRIVPCHCFGHRWGRHCGTGWWNNEEEKEEKEEQRRRKLAFPFTFFQCSQWTQVDKPQFFWLSNIVF